MAATISCEPADIVSASKCFDCIPQEMREPVEIYLLALIAGVELNSATLVEAAKCFQCIPKDMRDVVKLYLMCKLANDLPA